MARITLVQGDITEQDVGAIVNAANSSLLGGGGVDGAIHRRGGPAILDECRRLRAERYPDGLPTGQAVATTAGTLPARWVIHAVGPVYSRSEDRSGLLASCHTESLGVADELGARTVAFPAISTGVYRYPVEEAAGVAVGAVADAEIEVEEVRFVLFDEPTYRVVVSVRTSATAVRIAAVRPATLIRAEARPARGDRAAELRGFGRGPLVLIRRAGAARATARFVLALTPGGGRRVVFRARVNAGGNTSIRIRNANIPPARPVGSVRLDGPGVRRLAVPPLVWGPRGPPPRPGPPPPEGPALLLPVVRGGRWERRKADRPRQRQPSAV